MTVSWIRRCYDARVSCVVSVTTVSCVCWFIFNGYVISSGVMMEARVCCVKVMKVFADQNYTTTCCDYGLYLTATF